MKKDYLELKLKITPFAEYDVLCAAYSGFGSDSEDDYGYDIWGVNIG